MSFETDLTTRLETDGAISAIVGERIYWEIRPQNTALPALLLTTIAGGHAQTMDGAMATQGDQIQFDCMASTKSQAVALRKAVIAVIEAPAIVGDTEFQGGFVNVRLSRPEDTTAGLVRVEQVRATLWFN